VVSDAITGLLGMPQEEIYAERAAGKTLSEIAAEKGVTDQQLIDAMLAGRQEVIDQALADGRITQAQADWMQEAMKTMAPLMLTKPFGPGGMRAVGGMMGGMRVGRRSAQCGRCQQRNIKSGHHRFKKSTLRRRRLLCGMMHVLGEGQWTSLGENAKEDPNEKRLPPSPDLTRISRFTPSPLRKYAIFSPILSLELRTLTPCNIRTNDLYSK
jgi:hypothetical protein